MPNRIDNGPQQPISTNKTDAAESTDDARKSDGAQKSDATAGAQQPQDVWEKATTPYGSFMDEPGADYLQAPEMPAGCEEAADSMAVWEMMCDDARVSETESADAAFDDEVFDMSENKAARQLAGVFESSAGESMGPREVRSEFDIEFFQNLTAESRQDLIELAGHTDEFETRLADAIDDPRLAGLVADEVEQRVVRIAGDRIASRARPQLEEVAGRLDELANDTEQRRAFLGFIADMAGDQREIEAALANVGLAPGAAEELAEELMALHDEPETLRAFIDGKEGQSTELLDSQGQFERIDAEFQTEIEDIRSGIESLERDLTSTQVGGERLLTDPRVAEARSEVLAEMGAVIDGDDSNALGEFFLETTADIEASETREAFAIGAINFAGAVGASIATAGGASAPLLAAVIGGSVSGAQAVPEVAQARQDVDHAQVATSADLSNPELIERAETNRNVAYGVAAASVAIGAAGGAAGDLGANEAAEVGRNAGAEAADTGVSAGADFMFGADE